MPFAGKEPRKFISKGENALIAIHNNDATSNLYLHKYYWSRWGALIVSPGKDFGPIGTLGDEWWISADADSVEYTQGPSQQQDQPSTAQPVATAGNIHTHKYV